MKKIGEIVSVEHIEDIINSGVNYREVKKYLESKGGVISNQSNGSSYFMFDNIIGLVRVSNHYTMSLSHTLPSISIYSNKKDNYISIIESLEKLIN